MRSAATTLMVGLIAQSRIMPPSVAVAAYEVPCP